MILPALRRFVTVLLALALLAPASAFGRVLWQCSMSGKVSAGGCCCHKAKANKAQSSKSEPTPARASRPDCCEAQDHRRAIAPASHASSEVQVLASAPTQLLPALEPAAAAGDVLRPLPHLARGPPPRLPAYSTNCALLI